ncbi:methyltransferase [Micromonospora sp. CPCC 206061]|uniref:methyltransferase n=1 Tax=Micromonospora sp. CPCC 206061 TaxID=3122410 RepID=UPI002FF19007
MASRLYDNIVRLQELADYTVPLTIRAMCELGVADALAAGPRAGREVAEAVGAHPGALVRAMRALACRGIFTEVDPGVFALTEVGQLLRADHPLSMRNAYPLIPADLTAWAALEHTLRTGEAAFARVHGRDYYAHLAAVPEDSARVDRSVEAQNRLVLRTLLTAYQWARCGTVVDVAGGTGTFLAGLLARYRSLRGVLFDRPHVVARAFAPLAERGVADRCEVVAGDAFQSVPAGHDTYLLKTILHDWDDQRAVRILRVVRAAMHPHSRLIVLEALLPPGDEYHVGKLLDLHSLVLVGGPDRDLDQLTALLAAADLDLVAAVPTATLAVLEARPRVSGRLQVEDEPVEGAKARVAPPGSAADLQCGGPGE